MNRELEVEVQRKCETLKTEIQLKLSTNRSEKPIIQSHIGAQYIQIQHLWKELIALKNSELTDDVKIKIANIENKIEDHEKLLENVYKTYDKIIKDCIKFEEKLDEINSPSYISKIRDELIRSGRYNDTSDSSNRGHVFRP